MRPISPTCRTIVSVQAAKVSGSLVISFRYLRFSRSAESWIGVSGFLISCAMRRATSAQAALRCADSSSVTSSNVTTKPIRRVADEFGDDAHQQGAGLGAADETDLRLGEPGRALPRGLDERRHLRHDVGERLADPRHEIDRQEVRGRAVRQIDAPCSSRPITPAETPASTAFGEPAALVELVVGFTSSFALALDLLGHAVEGAAEDADLVAGIALRHARPRSPAPIGPPRPPRLTGRPDARRSNAAQMAANSRSSAMAMTTKAKVTER